MKKIILFSFCYCSLFTFYGDAQQTDDSLFYQTSLKNSAELFKTAVNENMQLYTGNEYVFIGHNVKGFPYLETDSLVSATICYNNILYKNIDIHYDVVKDVVTIKNYSQQFFIQLIPEKIDSFSFHNNFFVRIDNIRNKDLSIRPGFYQKLCSCNAVSLYAKKEKAEVQYLNQGTPQAKYVQYNSYFIQKNDRFYKIGNEHSLLEVLSDKKDILKSLIKKSNISFKKDFENSLIQVITYYCQ